VYGRLARLKARCVQRIWNFGSEIIERRTQMKPSTKNEVKGKIHEVKGKIKEKAGRATNNPRLEDEGTDEKIAGKVQRKVGQVQKVVEDF
jgi:uncharacterized protein YjbJ (UPF0337 family)